MWNEIALQQPGRWPDGVRLPIIISVHHQSEEAAVVFRTARSIRSTIRERQYGGRRGAWRLLEILDQATACAAPGSSAAPLSRNIRKSPAR